MMSERPGVPGRARGWENRQPQPAPCPVPAAASNAAFLARLQEPFLLGDALQCLDGKLSHWSCGCLLGQGSQTSSVGFPAPPLHQAWPGLLPPFTSGLEAGSPSRLAALRPTSFSRPVVLCPWAPGFHFWVWGASLFSPLSRRSSHQTTVPPKRKECVGVGGCFQFYSI